MSFEGKIDIDNWDNIIIVDKKRNVLAVGAGNSYPQKNYVFWKKNLGKICSFYYDSRCSIKRYKDLHHAVIDKIYSSKRKAIDDYKEEYLKYYLKYKKTLKENKDLKEENISLFLEKSKIESALEKEKEKINIMSKKFQ